MSLELQKGMQPRCPSPEHVHEKYVETDDSPFGIYPPYGHCLQAFPSQCCWALPLSTPPLPSACTSAGKHEQTLARTRMQTGLRSSMCTQAYDAETHFLARGDEPPFSAGSAGLFSTAGTVSPVAAASTSISVQIHSSLPYRDGCVNTLVQAMQRTLLQRLGNAGRPRAGVVRESARGRSRKASHGQPAPATAPAGPRLYGGFTVLRCAAMLPL